MLFRASAVLRQGEAARHWMKRIAARVPAAGMSGSQLQALLEDEFAAFTPRIVGAVTLKEAVRLYPDVLRLEEGTQLQSRWYVRPVAADSENSVSDTAHSALAAVQLYCRRCAREGYSGFIPLEQALVGAGVDNVVAVAGTLLRAPEVGLEVRADVRVKPKRLPRAAVLFVDGDALPAVAVDEMCNELNVVKEESSVTIVRQRSSHALSPVDTVCPDVIPTYLFIEKMACELCLRQPDVRRDIVYMCSASTFQTYVEHVAPLNLFPDADVYVCCPSKLALVQPKTVVAFE